MGRIRLLAVNHVGQIGGAEESLLILLKHLDRDRFTVRLAAPAGELLDQAAAMGVEPCPLTVGRVGWRGGLAVAGRSLARLAIGATQLTKLTAEADVLAANGAPAALLARLAVEVRPRPLVWHVRDVQLPPGLPRFVAGRLGAAIALSRVVASTLREAGVPPPLIHTIPNAFDPTRFQPTRPRAAVRLAEGLAAADQVVAIAAGWVPWKGHELLFDALARLAPTWPSLKCLVIGSDRFGEHPDLAKRLRVRAEEPPLAGRILFVGQRSDVADLFQAADVVAVPSQREPFGRVVLEAMAVGRPVVACSPGGPDEIMVAGVTGWRVPHGRPGALAAALAKALLLSTAERDTLREVGRRRLATRYDPARHGAAVGGLLAEVVAGADHDKHGARRRRSWAEPGPDADPRVGRGARGDAPAAADRHAEA